MKTRILYGAAFLLALAAFYLIWVGGPEVRANIGVAFAVTLLSLTMSGVAVRVYDKVIFPNVDFGACLKAGNRAVGLVVALIIAGAFIAPLWVMASPADHSRYDAQFRKYAKWEFGRTVEWQWFKAQGMTESGLNPNAVSHVGAAGVMQIMPGTAADLGVKNRFNAKASIRHGIRYTAQKWRQFTAPRPKFDRLAFAFWSYNAGLGTVLKWQAEAVSDGVNENLYANIVPYLDKPHRIEPREYVRRIVRWVRRFAGKRLQRFNVRPPLVI